MKQINLSLDQVPVKWFEGQSVLFYELREINAWVERMPVLLGPGLPKKEYFLKVISSVSLHNKNTQPAKIQLDSVWIKVGPEGWHEADTDSEAKEEFQPGPNKLTEFQLQPEQLLHLEIRALADDHYAYPDGLPVAVKVVFLEGAELVQVDGLSRLGVTQ